MGNAASKKNAKERRLMQPDAAPEQPYAIPTSAFPRGFNDSRSSLTESTCKAHIRPDAGMGADAAPDRELPPLPAPIRVPSPYQSLKHIVADEPVSGWIDETDDELEASPSNDDSTVVDTPSNDDSTVVDTPSNDSSTVIDTPTTPPQPKYKTTVIHYIGDDTPLIQYRPPPVPYEKRPFERAQDLKKHDAFRRKVADIMCVRLD
ncbi:hypothetical protein B0H13DRAFT_2064206 [Mycena leptocephala]|nr:hypothetical protein B0H13DRAFT_2064206 [Mycena leptocephala]